MGLTRRRFFVGSALALGSLAAQPRARPNVLLVMSDQESALLPGPVNLPHRARLSGRGLSFSYAFCNTPQCSPARASLLTGLEPHESGVLTNVDEGSLGKPLSPSIPTMGSVFQKAGYTTGYFGKWHLGNENGGLKEYGFETYSAGDDAQVTADARAWIRRQKAPWLGWVSLLNPHGIYHFPEDAIKTLSRPGVRPPFSDRSDLFNKPSEQREYAEKDQGRETLDYSARDWIRYRSYYLRLIEKVDAQLGAILGAVDLSNTIVVYTSDHGDALGEHGLPFKGPFMHEELIRIPLVIAGPGISKGVSDAMTTQAELAPAVAKFAGITWPGVRRVPDPHAVFLEYYAKQKWVNPIRTVRTRQWKLNWYDSGHKEFYDLAADPHETINLANDPAFAEVQSKLETRIEAWRPGKQPAGALPTTGRSADIARASCDFRE
jgi:arylsulfatase A-like enzyme